jgi:hypothetical protein
MTRNKRPRTSDADLQNAIQVLRGESPRWSHAPNDDLERVAAFLESELEKRHEDRKIYRVVRENPGIATPAGARKFLRRKAERDAF